MSDRGFENKKISENQCQSVVKIFLSHFVEIPYIKICGFRLTTLGDFGRP
jgi:hypothetical protein